MTGRLIVLRGNSGSGKSTVAAELRRRLGDGIAVVEQDYLQRHVLGARETNTGENSELIELVTRYALANAQAVVLEGILSAELYSDLLSRLASGGGVQSSFYYFDLPFEETVARHQTREKAGSFGEVELRRWFAERDLLAFTPERLIGATSSAQDTAARILDEAGLRPGRLLR